MKLSSKLMGILALLAVFTLVFLSADCGKVLAQDTTDKSTASRQSIFRPLVTFVEIGAANCIPCKMMQPIMKAVGEEYKGQVKVVFHDVWTEKGKNDAAKYNIRVIPTQVFLDKDGKEYLRHEGYFPKEDVVKVLKKQGVK
jgi:thioredoxin 1